MPKHLIAALNGKVRIAEQYSAGEIAYMLGVAHRTACKLIDEGTIPGFRLPGKSSLKARERRVHHAALVRFAKSNADYRYILDRIDGYVPDEPAQKVEATEEPKCKSSSATDQSPDPLAFRKKTGRGGRPSKQSLAQKAMEESALGYDPLE